jgi:cysteinyl-tRNA synthetase
MLTLNGKKMSKSTNNYILPKEIFDGNNKFFEKPFSPDVVKFFMFQAHYRSQLDLSNDALIGSEKAFNKIKKAFNAIDEINTSDTCDFNVESWIEKCYKNLNDDLNTPKLIANIFDVVKFIFDVKSGKSKIDAPSKNKIKSTLKIFIVNVFGLNLDTVDEKDGDLTKNLIELVKEIRDVERNKKNYELSDFIRERLNSLGINIEDIK